VFVSTVNIYPSGASEYFLTHISLCQDQNLFYIQFDGNLSRGSGIKPRAKIHNDFIMNRHQQQQQQQQNRNTFTSCHSPWPWRIVPSSSWLFITSLTLLI